MSAPVSVIVPTFNRAHLLERAIRSVQNQTASAAELIIVDDGSSDSTPQIVEKLQNSSPIPLRYFRLEQQKGVSCARNRGMAEATSPWLAFLDSDDEWLPNKLEIQFKMQSEFPQLKIFHGEEIWVRNGQRVNPMKKHQKMGGRIFSHCLPLCVISPSAVVLHQDLLTEVGPFNEEFVVCEDYDLWLRITSLYEVGFSSQPILIKYGGHDDQLSRQYVAMDYWRIKSIASILMDRPRLSHQDRLLAEQTLCKKAQILLRGYRKHNNLAHYHEIEKLASPFMEPMKPPT